MQIPEPNDEHRWLEQLVGEWSFEHECSMGPDQPPMKSTGVMSVRSLGGLWIVGEMVGEMPGGGESTSLLTLGYDPAAARFVGTFVASCMTHQWIYRGSLDDARTTLTLDTEGPNFSGDGSMAPYQDVFEIVDANQFHLRSQVRGADGSWFQFMDSLYRRRS